MSLRLINIELFSNCYKNVFVKIQTVKGRVYITFLCYQMNCINAFIHANYINHIHLDFYIWYSLKIDYRFVFDKKHWWALKLRITLANFRFKSKYILSLNIYGKLTWILCNNCKCHSNIQRVLKKLANLVKCNFWWILTGLAKFNYVYSNSPIWIDLSNIMENFTR